MRKVVLKGLVVAAAAVVLVVFACYVRVGATADAVVVLKTSGMRCSSCADRIGEVLRERRGVVSTEVDLPAGRVFAGFDSKRVTPGEIASAASAAGFASTVQKVLSPAQFKVSAGHEIGAPGATCGMGCCGNGTKTTKRGDS